MRDLRGVIDDDAGGADDLLVAPRVLEPGDDPDQEIVRGERELPAQIIARRELLEGREIDARRDDLHGRGGEPAADEDVLEALGAGDDGVDILSAARPWPAGRVRLPRQDPDGHLGPGGRGRADGRAGRVVEMGEDAALAPHGRGQAQRRPEAPAAGHGEGKDRQAFGGRVLVKGASRIDDETGREAPLADLPRQDEGLALRAAPVPAAVNMEKAQCALPFSISNGAWPSAGTPRSRRGRR